MLLAAEYSEKKLKNYWLLVLISGMYLFSGLMQATLFLNWDVSSLLYAAEKMLHGGTYFYDFFTPNPPLIMYFYMPIIIFSNLFSINIMIVFQAYIFLLSLISLCACSTLSENIFYKQNASLRLIFLSVLSFVILILPVYEFGQRDHLLVILTMPYLLLVVCRLKNKKINVYFAIFTGLFASIGFALKPQFLITLIGVELYFMLYKKSLKSWLRIEVLTMCCVFGAYIIILYLFRKDYLFVMAPYIVKHYYSSAQASREVLFFNPLILFCWIPVLFYILQYKTISSMLSRVACDESSPDDTADLDDQKSFKQLRCFRYKILSNVLFIALIGDIFSYYLQRTTYVYHFIPPVSLSILLLSLLLFTRISKTFLQKTLNITWKLSFIITTLFITNSLYWNGYNYKTAILNKLIAFIETQPPHQLLYAFTHGTNVVFPLVHYTDATVVQRFDCLWMIKGVAKEIYLHHERTVRKDIQHNKDKFFYVNMIVDDFEKHQPTLVFVQKKVSDVDYYFDFLDYFSENNRFKSLWKNYHYLTTLEVSEIYKLDVYQRHGQMQIGPGLKST